ncbi:MAG: N-formylglutamate amidohydrolase [Candidatus Cloacimonadaceae bacterium]|nr:N-formylglutamate amidohydrolase [Candidatus Cloacimonadaceae bacterium]
MIRSSYIFDNDKVPALALAIHSGHHLPEELLSISGIGKAERFREEDPYTDRIAELFPNRILPRSSRFAVDLNRVRDKAIYIVPEDCWGLKVRRTPIPDDVLLKLQIDYDDWYKLLKYQIDRLLAIHPFLLVLDLHSFNHRRGGKDAPPDPQIKNPDIIIGRSNLDHKHYPAAQSLCDLLSSASFQGGTIDCRSDVKFTGGYLSRWLNHHYSDRLICLAIEFKKIFMDEWSGELFAPAFEELKSLFFHAVRRWLKETYQIVLMERLLMERRRPRRQP